MPQHALSEIELKTLYAALSLGDGAAAAEIFATVVASGRTLLRSNFYPVLDALERKGYIASTTARTTTRGRPHAIRCVTVTEAGTAAVAVEHSAYARLSRGATARLAGLEAPRA